MSVRFRPPLQPSACSYFNDSGVRVNRPQRLGGAGTRHRKLFRKIAREVKWCGLLSRGRATGSCVRITDFPPSISRGRSSPGRAADLHSAGIRFESELLHHLYIFLQLGRSPSWSKASGFEPDNSMVRTHHDPPVFSTVA